MYIFSTEFLLGGAKINCKNESNDGFDFKIKKSRNRIKASIVAKKDIEMCKLSVEGPMEFSADDVFYANGFQSWTTSREFTRNDCLKGYTKLSNVLGTTKDMATVSGDYDYTTYGEKGRFHSHTYCYFRKKGSRDITLYGSKSERQGFTIFEADMNKETFSIIKDIEGLKLSKGQEYEVFDIKIIKGDFDKVFDNYFFKFVGVKKPKIDHLAGYTSWYNYFQNIDESIILRDLDGLDAVKEYTNIFQVDDGYESAVGDWLFCDGKKFPHGMKFIADKIHEKGYMAGLWLAPFNAQKDSVTLKKHPEWVIRDNETGKKLLGSISWNGAYTFDIYNEDFRKYLKKVFDTVLNNWGFDMVKLDFLYSQCRQPRNGKTRGEIMCDGIDLLRECCGDKLILGCGVPLGACMGVFDACRISCDADKNYESLLNKINVNLEVPSSKNAITNTIFRSHLNGRAFCNDPDVFFLRDLNIQYTEEQKMLHAKVNSICGDVLFVSDNAGYYTKKRLSQLKEFLKKHDYLIKLAEMENESIVRLDFIENGVEKSLKFDLNTGVGNIFDVL